jgi:hypothetical protein
MSSRWNVTNANMHMQFLCSILRIPDNSNLLIPISSVRIETKCLVLSAVLKCRGQNTRGRRSTDLYIHAEHASLFCEYVTFSLILILRRLSDLYNRSRGDWWNIWIAMLDNILFSKNFIFDVIILKLKLQFSVHTLTKLQCLRKSCLTWS